MAKIHGVYMKKQGTGKFNEGDIFRDGSTKHLYKFEGNVDDSIGTNHAYAMADVMYTDGVFDKSGIFDGDSKVHLAAPFTDPTAFTVSLWAKHVDNGESHTVFVHSQNGQFVFALTDVGFSFISPYGQDPGYHAATDKTLWNNNQWHHYVGIKNGNTVSLYIDGNFISSASSTVFLGYDEQAGPLSFGYQSVPYPRWLNGSLDQVRFIDRAITPSEVAILYNEIPAPLAAESNTIDTNGLILHVDTKDVASYPGSGTTMYDISNSGSAHNMSFSNVSFNSTDKTLVFGSGTSKGTTNLTGEGLTGKPIRTVSVWAKPNQTNTTRRWLMVLGQYGTGSEHWLYRADSFSGSSWNMGGGVGVTPNKVAVGEWVNVTTTYDGTYYKMYANGDLIGISNAYTENITSDLFTIGYTNFESGFIGEFRAAMVYNRALTQDEIRGNINALGSV